MMAFDQIALNDPNDPHTGRLADPQAGRRAGESQLITIARERKAAIRTHVYRPRVSSVLRVHLHITPLLCTVAIQPGVQGQ